MKFLFAPDSFKGSLTAVEITDILERAAARHFPGAETIALPIADGGEGTVDALLRALGGERVATRVTGPLFEDVRAEWGLLEGSETAVMEMAQASGLPLVPVGKRDPRTTTSLGTGEMMADALRRGVRRILMGLGGSATNDGGIGMLTALGAVFSDASGKPVRPVGGELIRVARADLSGLMPQAREAEITVLCDVTNPLLGESGATYVYGPQKGATPAIRDELEAGMANYARVLEAACGRSVADMPGAGAAGGLGAALAGALNGRIQSGISAVLDAAGFDEKLRGVDLVITGEGRMDEQSIRFGKGPAGVARRCAARGIPVAAIVGGLGPGAEGFFDLGECALMPAVSGPMSLREAMADARAQYEAAADRLFRALKIGMQLKA